jgi:TolB-like protein
MTVGKFVKSIITPVFLLLAVLSGCQTTGSTLAGSSKVLREVPRADRIPVMVLNFRNGTLKDKAELYEPWELGLPSMIMTDLETIGVFNIISREMLKEVLREQAMQQTGIVDEKQAVQVGRIVAAKYVLTGNYMALDGQLHIESRLLSVEYGTQLSAAAVTGQVSGFFDLEKQLVLEMTRHLGAVLKPNEEKLIASNVETTSVDASLQNYAGEIKLYKAKDLEAEGKNKQAEKLILEARLRFEQALQYDPGYERAKMNLASLSMGIPMTL